MGIPDPLKRTDSASQARNRIILATDRSIPALLWQAGSRTSFRGEIPLRSSGSDGGRMGIPRSQNIGTICSGLHRSVLRRIRLTVLDELPAACSGVRVFGDETFPAFTKRLWRIFPNDGLVRARSSRRNSPRCRTSSCSARAQRRCPTGASAISTPRTPAATGEGAATAGFCAPPTVKPTMP